MLFSKLSNFYFDLRPPLGQTLVQDRGAKTQPQGQLQSVSWSLAEFRHNKIVQSPHENHFNVCRQHKEK